MNHWFGVLSLAIALSVFEVGNPAWADLGPFPSSGRPRPVPSEKIEAEVEGSVPLAYRSDSKAPASTLIIPRMFLSEQADAKVSAVQQGWHEGAEPETVLDSSQRLRTIVAGLAMSLAVASVILLRNRNRAVKTLVVVGACGVGIFAASSWSLARDNSERSPKPNGRVVIQIVDEGDCVQFIRGKR